MPAPSLDVLTPRETEVLTQVAKGYSLPEIAQQLHRSLKTIESHRLALGKKLGASNRVELTRIAIAAGIAPIEGVEAIPEPSSDPPLTASVRENLEGKARTLACLEQINREVLSSTGPTFLRRLVTSISRILSIRVVGIIQLEGAAGERVLHPIAICEGEAMLDPDRYIVSRTPCENVLVDGSAFYPSGVAAKFPGNDLLQSLHAEGYYGIRLDNGQGDAIGVMVLVDDKPLATNLDYETILKFFAPRAGAELTQLAVVDQVQELSEELEAKVEQRTRELQQATAIYRTLVENMTEGLVAMDVDYRIIYANPRFCELAGRTREELVGKLRCTDLMDETDRNAFIGRQDVRETDTISHYRLFIQRPDATRIELHVAPRGLFNDEGDFIGSFGVVTDMADIERSADG